MSDSSIQLRMVPAAVSDLLNGLPAASFATPAFTYGNLTDGQITLNSDQGRLSCTFAKLAAYPERGAQNYIGPMFSLG